MARPKVGPSITLLYSMFMWRYSRFSIWYAVNTYPY